jgi:RNA polymerase sigma factor (sigma-70 family)
VRTHPVETPGPAADARNVARRRRLLRAARRGDHRARARLVESNLGRVRAIAARYRGYGLSFDDLVQEGVIGLLEAVERYDPGNGRDFETDSRLRVQRAIRRALTDQARLIRLPKHIVERRRALDRVEAALLAAGERPTPSILAAATGLPLAAVLEARSAPTSPLSLDEPGFGDGSQLESVVADPRAADPLVEAIAAERTARLELALTRLPARQRRIVQARWGLRDAQATNLTQLAGELNVSPRRTQTIAREALDTLRRELRPIESGSR